MDTNSHTVKPNQLQEIDLERLRKICQDYIDFIDSADYHEDNDYQYYVFETAMETFFGKDVWDFINSK